MIRDGNGITLLTREGEFPLLVPIGSPVHAALVRAHQQGCEAIWNPQRPAVVLLVPDDGEETREVQVPFDDYRYYDDRKIANRILDLIPSSRPAAVSANFREPNLTVEYHVPGRAKSLPYLFFDGLTPAKLANFSVNVRLDGSLEAQIITEDGFQRVVIEPGGTVIALEVSLNPLNSREVLLRAVHQIGSAPGGRCRHDVLNLLSGRSLLEEHAPTDFHRQLHVELVEGEMPSAEWKRVGT